MKLSSSVTKIFVLKSLIFPFKNIKRGVFLLNKIRVKNSVGADMHIGSYLFIMVTKLKILVQLFVKKKWLSSILKMELTIVLQ